MLPNYQPNILVERSGTSYSFDFTVYFSLHLILLIPGSSYRTSDFTWSRWPFLKRNLSLYRAAINLQLSSKKLMAVLLLMNQRLGIKYVRDWKMVFTTAQTAKDPNASWVLRFYRHTIPLLGRWLRSQWSSNTNSLVREGKMFSQLTVG